MPTIDRKFRHKRLAHSDSFDPGIPAQYPPDLELEPLHLDIDLFVDVANEEIRGQVTTTVVANGQAPDQITLDAVDFEDLAVRDVDGNELTWRYDGRKLAVHWDAPFTRGEQRRLEVAYRVTKPGDGLYFSKPNDAYPDQTWYAATDHETERARHWLPCIDLPNVRTKLDFHLRTESRFIILANGYLVEENSHDDGTKTAHWRLEQLCPSYLACFALGDFVTFDDGVYNDGTKDIPLVYFCSQAHTPEDLERTFGRTRPMMDWMTKKLDMSFPYPKYYQFALPLMWGAMENISLVSWSDALVQDETLALEDGWWVDTINLHEMAHSYFGDAIVCRDFAHAWLKESWAVYMEQVWFKETHSEDARAYQYFDDARRYFREADNRYKRPIVTRHFQSSWQMYDAHLYPGGACRLHTLCEELGEEVFWAATRDYLKRYNGKVVETDHFRLLLEEHSGRSLGKFFDQWFYSPGYPDIKVSFNYDSKLKLGTFEVEQKQVDEAAKIPVFEMVADLGWTIDDQDYLLPIKIKRANETFVVKMADEPQQVRFDPLNKVLHKLEFNPGDTMLRAQLTGAKDVIGRILAAQELVKTGKYGNIQAVVDAYANEPHWGVRREMAESLSEANSETAVAGMASLVQQEEHPLVLESLFSFAGEFRDPRIADALVARLAGDIPYYAQQGAYISLGKQRQAAPFELLLEASGRDSFNGIVQSGALHGLAATRREEAIDPLLARAAYGASANRARPAAVMALADIGKGLEKARREQIVEAISDFLRDPWPMVTWRAAYALQMLKAAEAIPALEAFSKTQSHQVQVDIQKIIANLRDSDKVDGSAVKKQVEELRETIRKLADKVDKLAAKSELAEGEKTPEDEKPSEE